MHIVYHSWEHYSSIRNVNGPATGLPEIQIKECIVDDDETLSPASDTPTKHELIVMQQCQTDDLGMVREALAESRGNIDRAVIDIFERQAEEEIEVVEWRDPIDERSSTPAPDKENDEKDIVKKRPIKLTKTQLKRAKKEAKKEKKKGSSRQTVDDPVDSIGDELRSI